MAASPTLPTGVPFPILPGMTWNFCFQANRDQILESFIGGITSVTEQSTQMNKLAKLIRYMMGEPPSRKESIAIQQSMNSQPDVTVSVPPVENHLGIGEFNYRPTGSIRRALFCHTVFDLLSALISEATYLRPLSQAAAAAPQRTKDSYYAPLASLHKYWCLRIRTNRDHRPAKTSIFYFQDVTVLGCAIPTIPGMANGKEIIRQIRVSRLSTWGRQTATVRQMLKLDRVDSDLVKQDFGNCAETWGFAMFCLLNKDNQHLAHGVALNAPEDDVPMARGYDSAVERRSRYSGEYTRDGKRKYAYRPYTHMCPNCEKVTNQIVRQGSPTDAVVENFTPGVWEDHYRSMTITAFISN